MEVSGIVFRPRPCFSCAGFNTQSSKLPSSSTAPMWVAAGNEVSSRLRVMSSGVDRRLSVRSRTVSGYSDDILLDYYVPPRSSGKKMEKMEKKEKEKEKEKEKKSSDKAVLKKKLKMVKGLSKDLLRFSSMGFGVEAQDGLISEVKGKKISEAADVLLAQLAQLRAEEKEMKKKKKEEKARLKGNQMRTDNVCESYESRESECGEVVDISSLRNGTISDIKVEEPKFGIQEEATSSSPRLVIQEMKKKKKEEKAKLKAIQTKTDNNVCESSSSSSSFESSNSECGEVVDMSRLRSGMITTDGDTKVEPQLAIQEEATSISPILVIQEHLVEGIGCHNVLNYENGSCSKGSTSCSTASTVMVVPSANKIEVCMGGKCKKLGAPVLMEEFERRVGVEGAVVGCKCMGKCRDGPNVRVLNQCSEDVDVSGRLHSSIPLCIGVGLEDVGDIIDKLFGEGRKESRLMAA